MPFLICSSFFTRVSGIFLVLSLFCILFLTCCRVFCALLVLYFVLERSFRQFVPILFCVLFFNVLQVFFVLFVIRIFFFNEFEIFFVPFLFCYCYFSILYIGLYSPHNEVF